MPQDFPIVSTRLIIAQWKQYSKSENYSPDNPVIALRFKSGKLHVTCQVGMQKEVLYEQTEEIRNEWLDFQFHIRFSRGENGRIKAWLNDNFSSDLYWSMDKRKMNSNVRKPSPLEPDLRIESDVRSAVLFYQFREFLSYRL
jgi:hypothetical protein